MLNLSKFFKKCDLENLEKEYEKKVLSKIVNDKNMKCMNLESILKLINNALNTRLSYHPLDVIGCLYVMDIIDEDDILKSLLNKNYDNINSNYKRIEIEDTPRNIILFKIIDTLFLYKEYKDDIEKLINTATEIEKSCFNATISNCRNSDEPPPRNWESDLFVEIYYSSRCGTILRLLSPNSLSSIEYGPILVNKLLSNKILPSNVGFMDENIICPESQEVEKINIQKRLNQKIEEKYSDLYTCPSCKQRKCIYNTVQRRALDEAPDIICKCLNPECLITFKVK